MCLGWALAEPSISTAAAFLFLFTAGVRGSELMMRRKFSKVADKAKNSKKQIDCSPSRLGIALDAMWHIMTVYRWDVTNYNPTKPDIKTQQIIKKASQFELQWILIEILATLEPGDLPLAPELESQLPDD